MFIYCIKNLINNKKYVGQTIQTIKKRFRDHKYNSRKGYKTHLYKAMRKYGVKNFIIYRIDSASSLIELNEKEIVWIKTLDTKNNGYNETDGGEGITGYQYTEEQNIENSIRQQQYIKDHPEHREKMSQIAKSIWENLTEDQLNQRKQTQRKVMLGNSRAKGMTYKHSKEAKKAISESHKGLIKKPETIEKFKKSRVGKGTGINNSMSNPEYKEKQRLACLGRKKMFRDDGSWYWGRI